jgi:hypothetical protein
VPFCFCQFFYEPFTIFTPPPPRLSDSSSQVWTSLHQARLLSSDRRELLRMLVSWCMSQSAHYPKWGSMPWLRVRPRELALTAINATARFTLLSVCLLLDDGSDMLLLSANLFPRYKAMRSRMPSSSHYIHVVLRICFPYVIAHHWGEESNLLARR